MIWYVYLLRCSDDTLYCGITIDIERRITQHNDGTGAKYTRGRGPVSLVKSFGPFTKSEALKMEYRIKQLSHQEKLDFDE